jgi:hypothetical protein
MPPRLLGPPSTAKKFPRKLRVGALAPKMGLLPRPLSEHPVERGPVDRDKPDGITRTQKRPSFALPPGRILPVVPRPKQDSGRAANQVPTPGRCGRVDAGLRPGNPN